MRAVLGVILLAGILAGFAVLQRAGNGADEQPSPGYYVLALSWMPSWCVQTGDARQDSRCDDGVNAGWLVHGLWPQNNDGTWPEFCESAFSPATHAQTAAMTDIMGSAGLAWHQWRKHGTCSGLSAEDYFAHTRAALGSVSIPPALGQGAAQFAPARVLDFLQQANADIDADMAIVTCQSKNLQEIRICLTPALQPRRCDDGVLARNCRSARVQMPAIR